MAGEVTLSTPTYCEGAAAVKAHADTLTLATVDDDIMVVPVSGREKLFLVFSVQRTA